MLTELVSENSMPVEVLGTGGTASQLTTFAPNTRGSLTGDVLT